MYEPVAGSLPAFMPHGYCLLWEREVLLLHIGSDALISLSYFLIPPALLYFVHRKQQVPFYWVFWLFSAFIFFCGITHALGIYTIWNPVYRLEGILKLLTGLISLATALVLIPLIPQALALRSPHELEQRVAERTVELSIANALLKKEITERKQAERALYSEKERMQVTLQAIGDGVISTDTDQRITYLNPVAEQLTGWSLADACAQPLTDVCQVFNEVDGEPASDLLHPSASTPLPEHLLIRHRNGGERTVHALISHLHEQDNTALGQVLVLHDVTEQRDLLRQMAHQAHHDTLTGLPNRRELDLRLMRAIQQVQTKGSEHVLCYLDLNRFKAVNDTAGHHVGDELLRQMALCLSEPIRTRDTLARIGGDEFCLLLENCPLDTAIAIARRMAEQAGNFRLIWDRQEFQVGVSIGLSVINHRNREREHVLQQADAACYHAKQNRHALCLWTADGPRLLDHSPPQ